MNAGDFEADVSEAMIVHWTVRILRCSRRRLVLEDLEVGIAGREHHPFGRGAIEVGDPVGVLPAGFPVALG
jgi:hypothetical protein